MKFYASVFCLILAFGLNAQTYTGVDRKVEFSDAFPEGVTDFTAYGISVHDTCAFQAETDFYAGANISTTAVDFTVDVSPDGAEITGIDASGEVVYSATIGALVLENVTSTENGWVKYFYCNRATENHLTVWTKGTEKSFDFLKPGGYILSVGASRR